MVRMGQIHVLPDRQVINTNRSEGVAREMGIRRLTVRKYLEQAVP